MPLFFFVIAFSPAFLILTMLYVWARRSGKHLRVFGFAALGCLASLLSPWFAMWYAWYVLNDHTANIGAGLLGLGQPVLAPLGTLAGATIANIVEFAGRSRPRSQGSPDPRANRV